MKKNYITPTAKVHHIPYACNILAGTTDVVLITEDEEEPFDGGGD